MVLRSEAHSSVSKEYRDRSSSSVRRRQHAHPIRYVRPVFARSQFDRPTPMVTPAIVVWDGRGITSDGQPYENSYAPDEEDE
jgi:hypothetical protein